MGDWLQWDVRGVDVEMVVGVADYARLKVVDVKAAQADSIGVSSLYAWRLAVLNGRLSEAAAIRRYEESFEDETTAADAEWQ